MALTFGTPHAFGIGRSSNLRSLYARAGDAAGSAWGCGTSSVRAGTHSVATSPIHLGVVEGHPALFEPPILTASKLRCHESLQALVNSGQVVDTRFCGRVSPVLDTKALVTPKSWKSRTALCRTSWTRENMDEFKRREREKAIAALRRFYRCTKDECCMNLLDLKPPTLERQNAFTFKDTVCMSCPTCGEKDEVDIYY